MPKRDLSRILERAAARPRTDGDVHAVWRRARSRRRRASALVAVAAVLTATVVVALAVTQWHQPSTPVVEPEHSPWGPLAVVTGTASGDEAMISGTLQITDNCVTLDEQGEDVLLVWPADATSWDPGSQAVTYTDQDGSTVQLKDGAEVSFGGGGDSSAEGGQPPKDWVAEVDWVAPPAAECLKETRWWISGVIETVQLSVPNLQGLSLVEAQQRLEQLGLLVEVVGGPTLQDPSSPDAVVVQQEPPAGSSVGPGAVVGFRTATITPELCDVLTQVPPRTGDARQLAASDGYWDMLQQGVEVAPESIAGDMQLLLDFHDTGQPLAQAPARPLDTVATHHDACHGHL